MKANLQFIARVGMILGVCSFWAACDFDPRRRVPPEGLLGFLAQITSPGQIVVGQYCGQTPTSNGNPGGYAAIHNLCVTACGSTTAHLCSPRELQLGFEFGINPPSTSWYGAFVLSSDGGLGSTAQDCQGWTSTVGTSTGPVVTVGPSQPGRDNCNNSNPFACCDFRVLSP